MFSQCLVINESDALKNSHSMMFTRALSVKSDVNGLLDIARATFLEYVDHLEEYVQVRCGALLPGLI